MVSDPPPLPPPLPTAPPSVDQVDPVDEPVSLLAVLVARRRRIVVTPAIVATNAAVFVAMVGASGTVSFPPSTLIRWGGLLPNAVDGGDWWRLLSAMWLHADPVHLGLNVLSLWQLGGYVERLLGPRVFPVLYLLTGVVASSASLLMLASTTVAVGASGAVFGMVGVLLAVAITARHGGGAGEMLGELRNRLIAVIGYNLLAGFLIPGIDNAAHIGGLVAGLAFGSLVAHDSLTATPPLRRTLLPMAVAAGLAVAAVTTAGDRQDVRREVARFGREDDRAETAFRALRADVEAQRRSSADAASEIDRTVLPAIREARRRADALLTTAQAQVAQASALDPYGRQHDWRHLPGFRADLEEAHAWVVFLARWEDVWRLRAAGLRDRDNRRLDAANEQAEVAGRDLTAVLSRPRPVNPS